jgi:hypothetical protein
MRNALAYSVAATMAAKKGRIQTREQTARSFGLAEEISPSIANLNSIIKMSQMLKQ